MIYKIIILKLLYWVKQSVEDRPASSPGKEWNDKQNEMFIRWIDKKKWKGDDTAKIKEDKCTKSASKQRKGGEDHDNHS